MIVAYPNANNKIIGDIILKLAFTFKFKKTGAKPIFLDNISAILIALTITLIQSSYMNVSLRCPDQRNFPEKRF